MEFPTVRLLRAGVPADQVADLSDKFDRMTPAEQESILGRVAPLADMMLAETLEQSLGSLDTDERPTPEPSSPSQPVRNDPPALSGQTPVPSPAPSAVSDQE